MVTRVDLPPRSRSAAWDVAATVLDPEVPVLTIEDLGILRDVREDPDGHVHVQITPTYSGCPAMDAIRTDIVAALTREGYDDVSVEFVLAPAWTTDWMSEDGKRKLAEYGIAPPQPRGDGVVALRLSVRCTQCGSPDTRELSRFGSTACKSLWVCNACKEPFDHFKAI
jgi:ring-1,2-phenylacetyl-CoA epoxidase subunit PaaD